MRSSAISFAILTGLGFAASAPSQTLAEKKTKPLSPAVEKALESFRNDCVPEKEGQLTAHMKLVMAAINEQTKLSAEELRTLEEKSKPILQAAVEAWKPRHLESLRGWVAGVSEKRAISIIKQWRPPTAATEPVEDWSLPDDLPAWAEAVKATLGAERYASWEKALAERTKKRDEQIAGYLKTWAEKGRKPLDDEIKAMLEDMAIALKLDEPMLKALKEAAKTIMDGITTKEVVRATEMFRCMTEATRKDMMSRNYYYVSFGYVGFDKANLTTSLPEWTAAARELLGAEKLTAWNKWRDEQNIKDKADLAKDLKVMGSMYKDQFMQLLTAESKKISAILSLTEDRVKALQKSADAAADAFVVEWERKMAEALLKQPPSFRREVLNRRAGIQVDVPGADNPRQLSAWVKAKESILTQAERDKLRSVATEQAQRTAASHARLLLSELDQRVGFSVSQREKLEPVITKFMLQRKKNAEEEDEQNENYSIDLRNLVTEVAGLNEQEVKPLLQEAQWKRWQNEIKPHENSQPKRAAEPAKPNAVGKQTDPPSVDSVISEHLYKLQENERKRRYGAMRVRVEEAARIGALTPQASARLESAAEGAVEISLTGWLENTAGWLRSSLSNATPQSVRAQIEGMGTLSNGSGTQPGDSPLWVDTVEEILPADAKLAWKQEQDARDSYRFVAIAKTVLAEVNRRSPITEEQATKLEPLIAKIAKEYTPDLNDWYSEPWYAYGYVLCTPLAGVSEKEMAEIFTPEELKRLKGGVLEQAEQYWSSIKENHESRLGRRRN